MRLLLLSVLVTGSVSGGSAFLGGWQRLPGISHHRIRTRRSCREQVGPSTDSWERNQEEIRLHAQGNSFDDDNSISFTLLAALAIAISYADRSNMSTAIIPMTEYYGWTSAFSGLVLSSFWLGYAGTQVMGGGLSDRYGGERLLVFAILAWSACTGLTPSAAGTSATSLIATRILLGAGEGLAIPAVHSMIKSYVPVSRRSSSAATITAACYSGSLVSNLASPSLIEARGWESCFYVFAILPLFFSHTHKHTHTHIKTHHFFPFIFATRR